MSESAKAVLALVVVIGVILGAIAWLDGWAWWARAACPMIAPVRSRSWSGLRRGKTRHPISWLEIHGSGFLGAVTRLLFRAGRILLRV